MKVRNVTCCWSCALHKFQRALGALVHKLQTATSARRARVRVSQKSKQAQKQVFTSKDHWNSPNLSLPHVFFANPSTRSARSAKTNPNARSARSTTNPKPQKPLSLLLHIFSISRMFRRYLESQNVTCLLLILCFSQIPTRARRARPQTSNSHEVSRKANKPKSKSSLLRIIAKVQTCLCLMLFYKSSTHSARSAKTNPDARSALDHKPYTKNP